MNFPPRLFVALLALLVLSGLPVRGETPPRNLSLSWTKSSAELPNHARDFLTIRGDRLPGGAIKVWYLEAYCRAGSTNADWQRETVIRHQTRLISTNSEQTEIRLMSTLADGVTVEHTITAHPDEVDFRVAAHNPTNVASQLHWAVPCVVVGTFTGYGPQTTEDNYKYIKRSFIFLDGHLERMPTKVWATEARMTPGQVWCPAGVPRTDVNPRPLNPLVPSNGLIGCYNADESMILATAWEPYQELFQGVLRCLHSDFRIGGLQPGETKHARGKIYIVPADVPALLKRYEHDFPEHLRSERPAPERRGASG